MQKLMADLPPRPWKFDEWGEVVDATGKLVITAHGCGGGDWFAWFPDAKHGYALLALVNSLDQFLGPVCK